MRTRWAGKLEAAGFVLYSLILGLFGLVLMSARMPGGSWAQLVVTVLFYFVAATPLGWFDHRFWALAGLLAWAPAVTGAVAVFWNFYERSVGEWAMIIIVFMLPIGVALIGGFAGAVYRRRTHPDEEFEEDERGLHGHFPRLLR